MTLVPAQADGVCAVEPRMERAKRISAPRPACRSGARLPGPRMRRLQQERRPMPSRPGWRAAGQPARPSPSRHRRRPGQTRFATIHQRRDRSGVGFVCPTRSISRSRRLRVQANIVHASRAPTTRQSQRSMVDCNARIGMFSLPKSALRLVCTRTGNPSRACGVEKLGFTELERRIEDVCFRMIRRDGRPTGQ